MKTKIAFINGTNYRVTNHGEVVNKHGRVLMGGTNNSGYQTHAIRVNNKTVNINTAREVYKAFKGEIPEGYEIMHIDGNKRNNSIKNLKAVTHQKNMSSIHTRKKLSGVKRHLAIKYERID